MLFDLHIHSEYSYDSFSKVDDILRIAKQRGLSGVAITDHEEIIGSLEAVKRSKHWDLLVIPGMEINTEIGDIIGLFIKEKITTTLFDDVVNDIKEQGGLVVLPHPFKRTDAISDKVLSKVDFIEVFNGRGENFKTNGCNQKAYDLSIKNIKPMTAGSDAHFLKEIGRGCIYVPPVYTLDELKNELLLNYSGNIIMELSSPFMEIYSQFIKAYKTKDMYILKSSSKKLLKILQWEFFVKLKKTMRIMWGL